MSVPSLLMKLFAVKLLAVTATHSLYLVPRASNQKGTSPSDPPTQQDQSHSHSKPSDSGSTHSTGRQLSSSKNLGSNKGHPSTAQGLGTEHSSNLHSRHAGSGKRSLKDSAVSQRHDIGDETLKSDSRPGSVSPSTQKSAHSRTLDPPKRSSSGVGGVREVENSNDSRGSSITKSLTPNLSPRSTLSASSSSGSLRQEAEYGTTATNGPTGGGAMGAEPKPAAEEVEERRREMGEGVAASRGSGESGLSVESELSSGTEGSNAVLEQLEEIHLSRFDGHVPPELKQSVIPQALAVTEGNVDPSISSPPGLSKSRSQPLPLSKQSERVCRKLDLSSGAKPSPLLASSDSAEVGPQMTGSRLLSRGQSAGESQGSIGSVEQRGTGMVPTTSLSNDGMFAFFFWTCFCANICA